MAEENEKNKTGETKSADDTKPLYSWKMADSVLRKRDNFYYFAVIIVGLIIVTILALQSIWSGAVLVAVATFMFTVITQSKPKNIESAIFGKGIVIDDRAYDYTDFKSFWIASGEISKVKFQANGRFAGQVTMPLPDGEIDKIRGLLSAHLPEEAARGEDLTDMVNRWLRF